MMRLRPNALVIATALLVASCTTSEVADDAITDPGRLVLWNQDTIGVLADGTITEVETTGAVSQVTAAPQGTLVWTTISEDLTARAFIDGADPITLDTPTIPFFYEWNPTGTRVAFLGNAPSGASLIFGLIDVEAETFSTIESPPPFFFDWSPDGERLIAHVGGAAFGLVEAATGAIEELPGESGAFPAPLWDERGIVLVTRIGPTVSSGLTSVAFQAAASTIVLLDPDDDSRTTLYEVDGPVRLFPGEESLALAVGVLGDQRIEVIGWDGTEVASLGDGTIDLVQWSPNGTTLLWTERSDDGLLTPKTWSDGDETTFEPFQPSTVFSTAYLPFWDQYDRTISLWSPDSTTFALPTADGVMIHAGDESSTYPDWDMAIWTVTPPTG